MEQHKRCKGPCAERKPVSAFSPAVRWPDGSPRYFMSYCRECNNKRPRDRKKARAYDRRWKRKRYRTDPEWRATMLERNRQQRGSGVRPCDDDVTVESVAVLLAVGASGLTTAEVARRVGRDWKSVNAWLRADRMRADDAALILDSIGVTPAEIGL